MSASKFKGTVGFIGLGDMGGGIAMHLAEVGVKLVVFDLNSAAMAAVEAKGARAATSLEDLTMEADAIIICVDPESQVLKVVDGLVPYLRTGQTVVIQSSVPPQWLDQMSERVAASGAKLFDAPVSGSYEDRKNGTLSVLVGARAEDVGELNDLFESIGRPMYFDALGAGEVAKLANNAIMMITRLAVSETMAYARAWGLSEENVVKAVKISSGSCFVIDNWSYFDQQLVNGNIEKLANKQKREIIESAESKGIQLPMLKAGLSLSASIDAARAAYLK